jgi:presenilin-like A22 family membrane protease
MKHSVKITLYLLLVFICAQVIGLSIISKNIVLRTTFDPITNVTSNDVGFNDLPYNIERPPSQDFGTIIYIILGVVIGTVLLLVIIKYRKRIIWKIWFFVSVLICLSIAFAAYVDSRIAFVVAVILGYFKIFRPNTWVHNITEVFIYGGIAAIFVPIINVSATLLLLVLISIYDFIAVWYSKHMVTLAEFQKGNKVFAGIMLPSEPETSPKQLKSVKSLHRGKSTISATVSSAKKGITHATQEITYAILGGGDIAFPLLFTGAVLKKLAQTHPLVDAFILSLVVTLCSAIALGILFISAKKDKYYPAMPFLTVGCVVGWFIVLLIA